DVCLVSRDGVKFYINRAIITYTSDTFSEMFRIPFNGGYDNDSDEEPEIIIQLSEDADTINALFSCADPTMKQPNLSVSQLWHTLTAAQKYQMEKVIHHLRKTLTAPKILQTTLPPSSSSSSLSSSSEPTKTFQSSSTPSSRRQSTGQSVSLPVNLIISNPLTVAILCHAFSFTDELRMALRELTRAHIRLLIKDGGDDYSSSGLGDGSDYSIPSTLFRYILSLRKLRAEWFRAKALLLLTYPPAALPTLSSPEKKGDDIFKAVDDQPSWQVFKNEALNKEVKCGCGRRTVPVAFEPFCNDWARWEEEARAFECALPDWP
ncbi:hypothetical protein CPB86DRAFT_666711, partial [Serendipita vermifera]